jgi:hypothetical protein
VSGRSKFNLIEQALEPYRPYYGNVHVAFSSDNASRHKDKLLDFASEQLGLSIDDEDVNSLSVDSAKRLLFSALLRTDRGWAEPVVPQPSSNQIVADFFSSFHAPDVFSNWEAAQDGFTPLLDTPYVFEDFIGAIDDEHVGFLLLTYDD